MGTSEGQGRWKRRLIRGARPAAAPAPAEAVPPAGADGPAGADADARTRAPVREEEAPPFPVPPWPAGADAPVPQARRGSDAVGRPVWPAGGAELLVDLLLQVGKLARLDARFDLLGQMDRGGRYPLGGGGYAVEVPESADARRHLQALVDTVAAGPDPGRALESLRDALRALAPHDRTLPWFEVTVLGLTGAAPLDAGAVIALVGALHPVADLPPGQAPTAGELARHVPRGLPGTHLVTGQETLPEILLRLSDLRAQHGRAPLLTFLTGLAADRELAAHAELGSLRALLRARESAAETGRGPAEAQGRLIVQIRVEAMDPEHIDDCRYELRGAYYRQPADGGPLVRLGALPPSEPLRRSELTGAGSARLAAWADLAREVRGASGGVRVEFLLPAALLGHRAEVWSAGASRTPLGQHHPVVVRSLERYSDPWINPEPWRRRWERLCQDPPHTEPLAAIAWPPLAGLTEWLTEQPESACLGLTAPYDDLAAAIREAVRDALFMEGVPVMVWRRDPGDPHEILTALRPFAPTRLRDLPESLHRCRKHGRTAGADDVRNNITLLWDDPDCVDADQDVPFAGMA
jgi:hypothetical protein